MASGGMQARAFVWAVAAGVAAALTYGALRLARRALHAGKTLTALLDLLFWLAAAGLTATAGALSGVEGLRLYMLLGVLCGFLLWEAGVRRALAALSGALRRKRREERV